MVRFVCQKCTFRFSPRNPENRDPPSKCPYCDTPGSVLIEQSAEELVKDIDDIIEH